MFDDSFNLSKIHDKIVNWLKGVFSSFVEGHHLKLGICVSQVIIEYHVSLPKNPKNCKFSKQLADFRLSQSCCFIVYDKLCCA